MGTLPQIFEGEREKADSFMNELLGYLLLNANVAGFESPIRQVALALTLIKGPRVDQWVQNMTTWLRGLDPVNDNVPRVWDYFTETFEQQFSDLTRTQRSRQQLEKLRFKFPDINQYIADFEDLANLSGYTVGNDETINLFLKGFEGALSPPLSQPCSLPTPPSSPTSHEQPPPTAWEQWANDWAKEMHVRRIAEDLEKLTLQYPVEPAAQATPCDSNDS